MTATLVRYWHTLRYLKFLQIAARARHVLLKPSLPDLGHISTPVLRLPCASFVTPIARHASMIGPTTFEFLNEQGRIEGPGDWNNPARAKLWLYNLHYFDDLIASGACERSEWHCELIDRWIRENPPGSGNGWEAYPLSLRIINWIKWALAGHSLDNAALASLYFQAQTLATRIEWHLLGNHLLANAKALIFAGLFFGNRQADDILARGTAILRQQLDEQILSDGGHFELSPMYHSLVLEDVLDLINLDQAYGHLLGGALGDRLRHVAPAMRRWLEVMTHPDGEIAFFNDAAFGIAGPPGALEAYAERLDLGSSAADITRFEVGGLTHLSASGYVRLQRPGVVALLDCAPIGPEYLPGHAHADTLSFELSLGNERVIVNGGTSVYGTSTQRQSERSTRAHSTVVVDGADSSEVWGGFRVARRAEVRNVEVSSTKGEDVVAAEHEGYRRLGGGVVHRRTWHMRPNSLCIVDRVTGRHFRAEARFHLGEGVAAAVDDSRNGEFVLASGRRLRWSCSVPAHIEPSEWHPRFGHTVATSALVAPLVDGSLTIELAW